MSQKIFKKNWYFLVSLALFVRLTASFATERKNAILVDKQFAVFKVEDRPYFSQDVEHIMFAISIVNCAFDQQGKNFFFRWAPHLMSEQNWPKNSSELRTKIKSLDLNELAFLGKIIHYEKEHTLNLKASPSLQKKIDSCSSQITNKINRNNHNLNSYLNSLVSFYSFILNHLDKGGRELPTLPKSKEQRKEVEDPVIKNFIDSIAKKYVHDIYHY